MLQAGGAVQRGRGHHPAGQEQDGARPSRHSEHGHHRHHRPGRRSVRHNFNSVLRTMFRIRKYFLVAGSADSES